MSRRTRRGTMVLLSSTGGTWLHNTRLEPARHQSCEHVTVTRGSSGNVRPTRKMLYRELRARVLQIAADGQLYRITVDLERQPSRPLAPASLCRDDNPGVTVAVLHRLVELDGLRASFETAVDRPPEVG